MASFTWPPTGSGGGVPVYSTIGSFPSGSSAGDLGVAADTGILYEWTGAAWQEIAGPGVVTSLGNLDSQTVSAKGAGLTTNILAMQSADATHPGLVNNTTQSFSGNKTFTGTIGASNLSGTNTGDVTLAAVGSSANANGASLTGQVLNLQPATASFPGALTAADWTTFNAKANATLNNLGTTAINASLFFDTDTTYDIGSTSKGAANVYSENLRSTNGSNLIVSSSQAAGINGGSGNATISTFSTVASGAGNSGSISLTTGNAGTGGRTGNSGSITLSIGAAGTTKGKIAFIASATPAVGNVWTALDSSGNGDWAANTAALSIGSFDAQAVNATGLALVSNVLSAQSADATHPGMVNTTTQSFAGQKTFTTGITGTLTGNASTATSATTAAGLSATLVIGQGGTGQTTKAAAFNALQPMTTTGDTIYSSDNSGTAARLAVGTTNYHLKVVSGLPAWSNNTPTQQLFTVTGTQTGWLFNISTTATLAVGDTYTNNSNTYTVVGNALSGQNGQVLWMTGTGATSGGTLTRSSGAGTASITFTAKVAFATYTTPSNCVALKVTVVGSGGGGGGAASTAASMGPAVGGGGGGAAIKYISGPASVYYYVVGTSAAGATSGNNNGTSGNSSNFSGGQIIANGGAGGNGTNAAATPQYTTGGGGAGNGTGGDINITGQDGGVGVILAATSGSSGFGGASFLSEMASPITNSSGTGSTGRSYGGGGAGGLSNGSGAVAGGPSSAGIVIVEESY